MSILSSHKLSLPTFKKDGGNTGKVKEAKDFLAGTQPSEINKITTKEFIVLKVRNGGRLMAAVSTSQRVAKDVLCQYIARSRQPHTQPHHANNSLEVCKNIINTGSTVDSGNVEQNIDGNCANNSENSRGKGGNKKVEEFSELLDPESTRNILVPMAVWRRSVRVAKGMGGGGVGGGSGLYWATYDPFRSSFSSFSCLDTEESKGSGLRGEGWSSLIGSIRSGTVLDHSLLSVSLPSISPSTDTDTSPTSHPTHLTHPALATLSGATPASESDPGSLRATLLLLQGSEPLISSAYPVSSRNALTTWEYYNLQLKLTSTIVGDNTPSLSSTLFPSSTAQSITNNETEFEISVSVELAEGNNEKNETKEMEKTMNAILNGKNRFIVSNSTSDEYANDTKNRLLATHFLQICFPAPGMFAVHVLCRSTKRNGHQGKQNSISTLLVEVHN